MTEKLFFTILPVQIMILAVDSVNSIVDGAVAGQFIDSSVIGVIGLYYSMVQVLSAIGVVFVAGSSVLCGKYIGRGEHENTKGIFSLNLTMTLGIGVVFTLLSVLFPGPLATFLGADDNLRNGLILYIVGFSFGIIPLFLSKQFALFLQFEGQSTRNYIGVLVMTVSNITLDIVLVSIMQLGVFGLALATSLSNIAYLLVIFPYFLSDKASLKYDFNKILWKDLPDLITTGVSGAILIFAIALRYIIINRILLEHSGVDGVSALASYNMLASLYIAFCLGNGSVVRMLISVFIGEKDKDSMKKVIKIVLTKSMAMILVISAVLFFLAPLFASVFFPDRNSNAYILSRQILEIYTFCLPFILICQLDTNYLQAMGHRLFIVLLSIFDGFFSVVVPAAILAPIMGALGVWVSNIIGVILVMLAVPVYTIFFWKRIPRSVDEWMFLPPDFGVSPEDSLSVYVNDLNEVSEASEKITEFCEAHNITKKPTYYSALCFEEMAGNVIRHGFSEKKKNLLNARIIHSPGEMILRIKDDCPPFDPGEFADMVNKSSDERFDNLGIKMVYSVAEDVNYQHMLGLNVLTVTIDKDNLLSMEKIDYYLEKTLKKRDPDLHRKFKDMIFSLQNLLSGYQSIFPEFTDHTELHSMTIIDSCNRLIGMSQIEKLNADEIYILLSACYLHDVGMGVNEKEYDVLKDPEVERKYFSDNPDKGKKDFIRYYHHEFSGSFIEKYKDLFEFPSPEYTFAIRQVVRGHRVTNLYDETEYPTDYRLPNGNSVNLPYLSAIIRLADEIDVMASRNPALLYDIEDLHDEIDILYGKRTAAIRTMKITEDAFVLYAKTNESEIIKALNEMTEKIQKTLNYCRNVIKARSGFTLTQDKVKLIID